MARRQTESAIQKAFFRAVRAMPFSGFVWATPNGGYRNKITASNMRGEGQMAGVWDVFVCLPRSGYHGMFIEFKRPGGRLTQSQKEFQARIEPEGYRFEVHTEAAAAFEAVKNYINGPF
jgi:hypothetical protein